MAKLHLVGHKRHWAIVMVAIVVGSSLPALGAGAASGPGDHVLLAAGDVAKCDSAGDEATAALVSAEMADPSASVAMLGDGAYPDGDLAHYQQCYDPSWGRFKAATRPATGNHEYANAATTRAEGYFDYWGAAAGPRPGGYYSYDLGAWHVVVLNSTCGNQGGNGVGGCNAKDPMGQWLAADLAATHPACVLAYWHHPRFYSMSAEPGVQVKPGQGASADNKLDSIWGVLQQAGADVVLSGHHHTYERFPRLKATGGKKGSGTPDPSGIRQFVAGTGGGEQESFVPNMIDPNSEKRIEHNFGVLRLTLHDTGYDWAFLSAGTPGTSEPPAGTVLDSGSDTC
ncbi:MAG: acid phosphatase type 7 [Actinomycetota bacterium]|nr:acid phosphatase type 7 [Actinomycetota bacterium]